MHRAEIGREENFIMGNRPNRKVRREFDLDEFEESALEAMGSAPGLTLRLKNGDTVVIPHPLLVDDELQERIERVQKRLDLDEKPKIKFVDPDTGDEREIDDPSAPDEIDGEPAPAFTIRFAKAILGEEDHARFLAGGGTSAKVGLAWQYLTEGMKDAPKLPRKSSYSDTSSRRLRQISS